MKQYSWLKKAVALGTVFFISLLLIKPIGVSTQFSVLSGIFHSALDENIITENKERTSGYESTNSYYDKSDGKLAQSIKEPWNYNFIFVLAIPFGAYTAYAVRDKRKRSEMSGVGEDVNQNRQGFLRLYVPSFLGGAILLYGARMADGCTSGHMMSGIMQGSVSGYIFAIAVFLVAIPTAVTIGNTNGRR